MDIKICYFRKFDLVAGGTVDWTGDGVDSEKLVKYYSEIDNTDLVKCAVQTSVLSRLKTF